jgi:hypothetical protein
MTIDERFERIDHIGAGVAEERRRDRETDRRFRETDARIERMISPMGGYLRDHPSAPPAA